MFKVVTDVFAEADRGVIMPVAEFHFDEAAADVDDCGRGP